MKLAGAFVAGALSAAIGLVALETHRLREDARAWRAITDGLVTAQHALEELAAEVRQLRSAAEPADRE
jgi:hypothetical protein